LSEIRQRASQLGKQINAEDGMHTQSKSLKHTFGIQRISTHIDRVYPPSNVVMDKLNLFYKDKGKGMSELWK